MTYAADAVWVGSNSEDGIFRIDPATNTYTTIHLGQDAPASITSDGSTLWVSNRNVDTVTRYELASSTIVATIPVGRGPVSSAIAADGSVLVPSETDGTISRIDPATNAVVQVIPNLGAPLIVRAWLGDLWVGDNKGDSLYRIHLP
jgi:DNA-binding beta-propeller fold protein YncE